MPKMNDYVPSKEECLLLLKKYNTPPNVIKHCELVASIAERIASVLNDVDSAIIIAGAMLHDIGRSVTHSIFHAVEGVKILKQEGISNRVINAVKNHIGTGIPKIEAKKLGLPEEDYIPQTIEEEIVSFADKCVIGGDKEGTFREAKEQLIKKFGRSSYVVKGLERQKNRILAHRKQSNSSFLDSILCIK